MELWKTKARAPINWLDSVPNVSLWPKLPRSYLINTDWMNNSSCTRFVCSNEVHPHHTNKPESSQRKHKLNMHLTLTSPMTCREKLITFDERCKPLHKQLRLCGRLMFVRLCWYRWSRLSTWTFVIFWHRGVQKQRLRSLFYSFFFFVVAAALISAVKSFLSCCRVTDLVALSGQPKVVITQPQSTFQLLGRRLRLERSG